VRVVSNVAESELFQFKDVLLQTFNPSENMSKEIDSLGLNMRDFILLS
jgi:hypothetical protein